MMAEKCKDCAACCINIAFTLEEWERWKEHAQRPFRLIEAGDVFPPQGYVLPLTASRQCVFVSSGKRCAIYAERPDTCRRYGSEEPQDSCPWWSGPEPRHTVQRLKREVRHEIKIELPADAVISVSQQDANGYSNGTASIRWTEKREP